MDAGSPVRDEIHCLPTLVQWPAGFSQNRKGETSQQNDPGCTFLQPGGLIVCKDAPCFGIVGRGLRGRFIYCNARKKIGICKIYN
jgi:hypothetical protein